MNIPIKKIEVEVPDCPSLPPCPPMVLGIPSWVIGWGMAVVLVIIIAIVIGVVAAKTSRNESKVTIADKRYAAVIALGPPKRCHTCGDVYEPEDAIPEPA